MFKKIIAAALALASTVSVADEVKNPNFTDYSGGNISINNRVGADDIRIGDTNYVEGELWFGVGDVHFYGYADVFEDGNTFLRLDPKWFMLGTNVFANYQYSSFAVENGLKDVTHYAGVGYRFGLDKGFIDASINAGRSDNELASHQGEGGYAVLTNGTYNLGDGWAVNGWSDYKFGLHETAANGSSYTWSGNVGVQKTFNNDLYVRVAPQWMHDEADSDISVHTQVGYTF